MSGELNFTMAGFMFGLAAANLIRYALEAAPCKWLYAAAFQTLLGLASLALALAVR